jgi:hypothetical protein
VIEGKIEGRIEVTGRRGRRRKQLYDLKEKIGYWKLREEALDCALGITRFVRDNYRMSNKQLIVPVIYKLSLDEHFLEISMCLLGEATAVRNTDWESLVWCNKM